MSRRGSLRFFVFGAIVFCLNACKSPESVQDYRGVYVYGHEVEEFTPCDSTKSYWLSYSPELEALKASVAEIAAPLGSEPYSSVYIEFKGRELKEPLDGFSEAYDGLIQLDSLSLHKIPLAPDCSSAP